MATLGLDIGGANIKLADTQGLACAESFPLWKQPERLADALARLQRDFIHFDRVAVTMTGEMADCFATRRAGVTSIVNAIESAFRHTETLYFGVDGHFHAASSAIEQPWNIAASNWRALAQWACDQIAAPTILVDIGSTTTDILRLVPGSVLTHSRTDVDRMQSKELVYTGMERSNVAGILSEARVDDRVYPIVNESFADTADAYRVLELLEGSGALSPAADGQDRSLTNCLNRLSRCIGGDQEMFNANQIKQVAQEIFDRQIGLVQTSLELQLSKFAEPKCEQILLSGHGNFLAQAVLKKISWSGKVLTLDHWLSPIVSRCAPAYAVAALADNQEIHRATTT